MMKLAILTPGFKPVPAVKGGAVEQLIEDIIDGNEANHKYDIDLYTISDSNFKNIQYKYTNLIKIKPNKENKFFKHSYFGLKSKITIALKLKIPFNYINYAMVKAFKTNYYDAVLVENNMDIYNLLLPKLNHEKIYFHLHNNIDCGDPAKTVEKTKNIINTADCIFVVSNFLKDKLEKLGAKKVKVISNAIVLEQFRQLDIKKIESIRRKYGIEKKDTVYTFVGRICSDKGIDKLILAMQAFKHQKNIKCLIVGNNFFGTSSEDRYMQHLQKIGKGLENQLIFTGYVDNKKLYEIYGISNVVVIPSQWEEVFGVVALEAMAMKLPVIAARSGALPSVLSNSCAFFVSRGNNFVFDLEKEIEKFINNPELQYKMGMAGFKRVHKFPNTALEYFDLIYNAINQ
ncbi:glycosyltransferase family 4 protein [Lactobacillus sp. PSON]|uniref:glycosyltransferase family 4 protein n=1 Tax=Lactobacillus sp. PSON TaxID=3455454 RepID=UPI00404235EA